MHDCNIFSDRSVGASVAMPRGDTLLHLLELPRLVKQRCPARHPLLLGPLPFRKQNINILLFVEFIFVTASTAATTTTTAAAGTAGPTARAVLCAGCSAALALLVLANRRVLGTLIVVAALLPSSPSGLQVPWCLPLAPWSAASSVASSAAFPGSLLPATPATPTRRSTATAFTCLLFRLLLSRLPLPFLLPRRPSAICRQLRWRLPPPLQHTGRHATLLLHLLPAV